MIVGVAGEKRDDVAFAKEITKYVLIYYGNFV